MAYCKLPERVFRIAESLPDPSMKKCFLGPLEHRSDSLDFLMGYVGAYFYLRLISTEDFFYLCDYIRESRIG